MRSDGKGLAHALCPPGACAAGRGCQHPRGLRREATRTGYALRRRGLLRVGRHRFGDREGNENIRRIIVAQPPSARNGCYAARPPGIRLPGARLRLGRNRRELGQLDHPRLRDRSAPPHSRGCLPEGLPGAPLGPTPASWSCRAAGVRIWRPAGRSVKASPPASSSPPRSQQLRWT